MNIKGGALEFDIIANNGQINSALDETKKRVQGFTDATVEGGDKMEVAYNAAAKQIEMAFNQLDSAGSQHRKKITELEAEYKKLGTAAGGAYSKDVGGGGYRTDRQQAIVGEIKVRQQLLSEIEATANELNNEQDKLDQHAQKVDNNVSAEQRLATVQRGLINEMAKMELAGETNTEAYRKIQAEAGRLKDTLGDVKQQAKILGDDEATFKGVMSGLSGLAGGFSAVTGTVALFSGENEDLQRVMTKVQSVMAITLGMQQVAETLNKDSYARVVLSTKAHEFWAAVKLKAAGAEATETAATVANTVAKTAQETATAGATVGEVANTVATGAQATAATVGTVANVGLAGAFRLVGAAIKSIPVFGWILAGISALIGLYAAFSSKSREAKKEQEELTKSVVEGSYKQIGSIQYLSTQWNQLGNDLVAKKKFIEDNKKAFDDLGVSINSVSDAEKLLNSGTQDFINAQIAKAKAAALIKNSEDIVKESIEADQDLANAKKTPKVTRYYSNGMYGGMGSYTIDNPDIKDAIDKKTEANTKLQGIYKQAAVYEKEGLQSMKKLGLEGVKAYKAGTVGAIEQAISAKQEALKKLSNPAEIKALQKDIEKEQKQLDAMMGVNKKVPTPKAVKDPYLEALEKRKAKYSEYYKWINSKDSIVQNAAKTEFAGLLKEGSSYLDYLKNQRDQLMSKTKRTPTQNKQLSQVNNEIASETKDTVLAEFDAALKQQLNNANSVIEKLDIIRKKREELKNDSSQLGTDQKEVLDNSEKEVTQKAQDDYKAAQTEYSNYLDSKIKEDVRYFEQKQKLEAQISEEKDPVKKQVLETQLKTITVKQELKDVTDYNALIEQYKNYQQRITDISATYDEQIALTTKNNNTALVAELQKAKEAALSNEAFKELQSSDTYTQLFSNLDKLSVDKMIELRNKLELEWSKLKLSPEQLNELRERLGQVTSTIEKKNPFAALSDAIKTYKKDSKDASKKDALKDIFKSASASIDLVKGSFDAVVGSLDKMGISTDEQTKQVLNDVSGMLSGASNLAMGIASGNPLQIIQGSVDLISNGIDLIAGAKDRKLEKQIQKHAKAVKNLGNAYKALQRATEKALGTDYYQSQELEIANLQKQITEVEAMRQAEEDKKKTDRGKIDEYNDKITDLKNTIENTQQAIIDDLLQGTIKDFASQMSDALVEAFANGEDAAKAFDTTINNILNNIVKNAFQKNVLEKALQPLVDTMTSSLTDDYMLSPEELAAINSASEDAKAKVLAASDAYKEIIDSLKLTDSTGPTTSLSGAIKGASQESIDLLAGQTNAVRVNQVEGNEIMRQQLIHLVSIDNKIGVSNTHLESIDKKINSNSDPLRAQGL